MKSPLSRSPLSPLAETDPDAPPSADELREAGDLRDALLDVSRENEDAALARALVLAHRPRELEKETQAALLAAALVPSTRNPELARPHRNAVAEVRSLAVHRSRRSWVVAGASILALAASALLFESSQQGPQAMLASLDRQALPAYVRSAQPLFQEPFSAQGGASARIDRIARARARDLRENRFAQWDVR